jgi:hypothetical protein
MLFDLNRKNFEETSKLKFIASDCEYFETELKRLEDENHENEAVISTKHLEIGILEQALVESQINHSKK